MTQLIYLKPFLHICAVYAASDTELLFRLLILSVSCFQGPNVVVNIELQSFIQQIFELLSIWSQLEVLSYSRSKNLILNMQQVADAFCSQNYFIVFSSA